MEIVYNESNCAPDTCDPRTTAINFQNAIRTAWQSPAQSQSQSQSQRKAKPRKTGVINYFTISADYWPAQWRARSKSGFQFEYRDHISRGSIQGDSTLL